MKKYSVLRVVLLMVAIVSSLLIMGTSRAILDIKFNDVLRIVFIDSKEMNSLGVSNVSMYVFFFFCYLLTYFSETVTHYHDTRLFESLYLHKIDTRTFIFIEIKKIVKSVAKSMKGSILVLLVLCFISVSINGSYTTFAFVVYMMKLFNIICFFSLSYQLFVNKTSGNKALSILVIPCVFVVVDVLFFTSIITFSNNLIVEISNTILQGIIYCALIMFFKFKIYKISLY